MTSDIADDLLDFAVYQQICRLKSRYFFCLDTKQWPQLRMLFSDDATFEGFPFATHGPDAFVEGVSVWLGPMRSVHHGMMPELRSAGPRLVRGRWAMQDYLTWPRDSRVYKRIPIPGMYGIRGYGFYDEEYTWEPTGWRISFMRLTRLRIDPLTGGYIEPPPYDGPAADTGWLER
ncbi:nuclear transport factor 2 family protein [Nonomuraea deserti]|uniref:Nuclear transport factor 2 family protein n=1 Tax=Nonomuraea deserti TaxID=1848322 RepID=A0A4R4UZ23_9ACTN|nr:nuclear transport factor 2 family protein [Nonomuraea deserti]TDC98008.1 nuclear transport factor 2 family protein [Nonomuraea deserti]